MTFLYNDYRLKARRADLRNEMTDPEQILWYWLRGKQLKGYKFRRQYSVGYYILDFYCTQLRLGIEVDGDSHFTKSGIEYDQERDDYIKANDIMILRFTNLEVTENIEGVIDKILSYLP